MIYIIRKILSELGYEATDGFNFSNTVEDQNEEVTFEVSSFVSNKSKDTCILCCTMAESNFLKIDDKELIVNIASNFRSNCQCYMPEMDKNTSLILCVKRHETAALSIDRQRRIEDDSFYFKKYVLLYSENELAELKKYIGQQQSVIDSIKEYVYNKPNFDRYKANPENNHVYSAIINLITKLPIIPMNFTRTNELYDIAVRFSGKLSKSNFTIENTKMESVINYLASIDEKEITDFRKAIEIAEKLYDDTNKGEHI